jgi:hypothetical protein
MLIQVSSNHGPRGSGGATIGKTAFTCVYIEKKNLLQNQQANFNQTWYKSSLGKGNFEPLSHNSLDIYESFLT